MKQQLDEKAGFGDLALAIADEKHEEKAIARHVEKIEAINTIIELANKFGFNIGYKLVNSNSFVPKPAKKIDIYDSNLVEIKLNIKL